MGSSPSVSSPYALLSAGVDTLYWSARVRLGQWFDDLRDARSRAAEGGDRIAWRAVDGFALDVLPHGAFRYPVVVDCREFRLHITDSNRLPTLWVQLRSTFIHEVGLENAIADSVRVASSLVGAQISEPKVSRLDLYADFGG